jgi:fatty acid desaturase
VRAHLQRAHHPASGERLRLNRFAEGWAAVSIGLMIVGFVLMVLFAREYLLFGLVSLVSLVVFIEATFRRRVTRLVASVTTGLAIVSALVLLFEFFWDVVIVLVLVAGGYIIWENIRELRP